MGVSRVGRGAYVLFAIVTLDVGFGNLSQSGMNTMLPDVMSAFGITIETGQWITTGFMLVMAISMSPAAYLYHRLAARTYVIVSLLLALCGSVFGLAAPNYLCLMAGRILQAIGTGLSIPFMQTVAMEFFPPGRQATLMGVAGIALSFVPNIGPAVGGILNSFFGWRSFFALLIGVFAVLLACCVALVPARQPVEAQDRFDLPSFILSSMGFGGILMCLSQIGYQGLSSAVVLVSLLVGLVSLVAFFRRQKHLANPFMDLRVFESGRFCTGLVASCLLFACYMGAVLVIPLYIQDVLGGSSLDSAFVLMPSMLAALVVNPLAGWLADKTSYRVVLVAFGALLVVGSAGCALLGTGADLPCLAAFQTLRIIGVSGLTGPLTTYALSGLSRKLSPSGSSALAILRQMAGTFGTASMVLCVAFFSGPALTGAVLASFPYQAALVFSCAMGALCLATIIAKVRS